ncbi:MAG: 16S rRNA (guanine(527)-N(7))-methyltransferase RsmG [Aquimonas sp.]|nr:16S rRNA (guanine(527)-N(7))-methyltransferase RsmG [Aquimonas sp.]
MITDPALPDDIAALQPRLQAGLCALCESESLALPLLAYLALLRQWNGAYNLTAVREPDRMLGLHLLDSLSILPALSDGSLVDIGSGAGLPGIPLAIARPRLQVSLVEPVGKKARFLREVVRQLKLANVQVFDCRAERMDRSQQFDCLSARALGSLAQLIEFGAHLLKPQGRLLAMKGQWPSDELAALPAGWALGESRRLTVPEVEGERHLLVLQRSAA